MDDTLYVALVLRLYGENISAVTDGYDVIHQRLLHVGRANHLVKALSYPDARLSYLAPDVGKLGTGGIGDLVLAENGVLYLILQPLIGGKLGEKWGKRVLRISCGSVIVGETPYLPEHHAHVKQFTESKT